MYDRFMDNSSSKIEQDTSFIDFDFEWEVSLLR